MTSNNINFSRIPCTTKRTESLWEIFFTSLLFLLHPVASSVKWIFFSLLLCASLGCTIFLKYAHLPYFLICSHSIPFYVSEKMSGKCTIYIQIRSRHASPAETSAKNEKNRHFKFFRPGYSHQGSGIKKIFEHRGIVRDSSELLKTFKDPRFITSARNHE